jgi:hypothetical protein
MESPAFCPQLSLMKKRDRAYYQEVMFKVAAEPSAAFQAAA